MRTLGSWATLACLLCAISGAHAQEAPPAAPESAAAQKVATPPLSEGGHAQRVLRAVADREHDARIGSGYSMFVGAAASIPIGLVADLQYDRSYGRVLWVAGSLAAVGGVMNLLIAGPFERMAREAQALSPSELQREWSRRAIAARGARYVGGFVGMGTGAVLIGLGAAFAGGLGDLERQAKQDWTTVLIAFGGAVMGQGLASLFIESPFESSYRMAYGTAPKREDQVSLRFSPGLGGAALSLNARF